jgi:hypothetical protein
MKTNQKILNEDLKSLVAGVTVAKDLRPEVQSTFNSILKFAKDDKTPIMGFTKKSKQQATQITSIDDLFYAIKNGGMDAKSTGQFYKGILKSPTADGEMVKLASKSLVESEMFLKQYGNLTDKQLRKILGEKKYSQGGIEAIVGETKTNKNFLNAKKIVKLEEKLKQTTSGGKKPMKPQGKNKPSTLSKITTSIGEKISQMVSGKWNWKRIVKWCAGLGITGAALWWYFYSSNGPVPDDTPEIEPVDESTWGPCLNYMIKNMGARIKQSPTQGMVVTTVPNAEYPGGLQFYSNGRMVNLQTKDKGTWKCVGGQAQTNENMSKTQVNESLGQIVKRVLNERFLMEQSNSQIDNDVEDMIDYLDFPVYGNDYVNIYNLLKKYGANGKYKEFAEQYNDSGFAKTSLRSDINSIYTIDAAPTRMKKQILALLDQIESGKVLPSTSTSNTKTGSTGFKMTTLKEQELQMSWDKDRKPGGGDGNSGGGGSTTTRKTYYDCTNVNIETTPLTYGCKSSKIGEIQKCLGVSVDNKFGPNTRKALIDNAYDMSKGITKEIYTKVLSACNPTASSTEGGADVKYLRTPIKLDLGAVPQMPTKKTSGSSDSSSMTDAQFYQSFVDSGLITRNLIGRIVYKGQVLEPEEKSKLDNQMASMGYSPTREAATDEGERYVWKRD